ncbi:MAG: glycosyltransferase domain-containing protein [Parcubacteria group bacterium]
MNKKVIYTAIFGKYDVLHEPEFIPKGFDFVCFTDMDLESKTWDIRKVQPVHEDPMRSAKIYKILPHEYLPEYEYSIWADGNMLLRGDANELIDKYLNDVNIAMYDHSQTKMDSRNSVYEEGEMLFKREKEGKRKDDPELIKKQLERYKQEGYKGDNGLISGMIIVRRHNALDVIDAMEAWWNEIEDNSKRDQLSFNYIAWKKNLNFVYVEGDSRDNRYFLWLPHGKKEKPTIFGRIKRKLDI